MKKNKAGMTRAASRKRLSLVQYGSGDCYRIAEGSHSLEPSEVLGEFLWESGYDIDNISPQLVAEGLELLQGDNLHTLVKADEDFVEDWEPGQYHTDGSGKRHKHFWWVDSRWIAYLDKIDKEG